MERDLQTRWLAKQPITGVAFSLNDMVQITLGPSLGARGGVVSLEATCPVVLYRVELESGSDLEVPQTALVGAQSGVADELARLQRWYSGRCDGTWEHMGGLEIATLDNPGWSLKVDIRGTSLEHRPFTEVSNQQDERAWLVCRVVEGRFEAFCGPHMLGAIVGEFLRWAEAEP